jgi:hypothetical protein
MPNRNKIKNKQRKSRLTIDSSKSKLNNKSTVKDVEGRLCLNKKTQIDLQRESKKNMEEEERECVGMQEAVGLWWCFRVLFLFVCA